MERVLERARVSAADESTFGTLEIVPESET